MNQAASRYRRQVRHAMHCSRASQEKRLHDLDLLLTSFTEENPEADIEEIAQKFGSPTEMADSLCEGISKGERMRWKRQHQLLIIVCILLSIGIIVGISYSIAIHFAKAPFYVTEEVYIYDNPS